MLKVLCWLLSRGKSSEGYATLWVAMIALQCGSMTQVVRANDTPGYYFCGQILRLLVRLSVQSVLVWCVAGVFCSSLVELGRQRLGPTKSSACASGMQCSSSA